MSKWQEFKDQRRESKRMHKILTEEDHYMF
jgi:hypothetical protein